MSRPLHIQRVVADHANISIEKLRERRDPHCARARHIAMWLTREICEMSYPQIGGIFKRDHSTVLNAVAHINEQRALDPQLQLELDHLKTRLEQLGPHERVCGTCGQTVGIDLRQSTMDSLRADIQRMQQRLELLEKAGA